MFYHRRVRIKKQLLKEERMNRTNIFLTAMVASAIVFVGSAKAEVPAFMKGLEIGVEGGYGILGTPENDLFDSPDFSTNNSYSTQTALFDQSHDIGDFVWGVHVGYNFKITEHALLGFELGYKNLGGSNYSGTSKYTQQNKYQYPIGPNPQDVDSERYNTNTSAKVDINQQAVDLLFTGHYFIWQSLNLFGKIGVAYVDSEINQKASATRNDHTIQYISGQPYPVPQDFTSTITNNYDESIWRFRPEIALGIGYTFMQHLDVHLVYDYIFAFDRDVDTSGFGFYWNNDVPNTISPYIYSSSSVMLGASWIF
jgi:hypothetical protein